MLSIHCFLVAASTDSPLIVSVATPMTAEMVCAPDSNPAPVPASKPNATAVPQVTSRQSTQMMTAKMT